MSIPPDTTFQEELKRALEEAELPPQPQRIIGSKYQFNARHGSHHFMLAGFVTSLIASDEGGLDLEVTNKQIWGGKLLALKHGSQGWAAKVAFDEEKVPAYIPGEFRLF